MTGLLPFEAQGKEIARLCDLRLEEVKTSHAKCEVAMHAMTKSRIEIDETEKAFQEVKAQLEAAYADRHAIQQAVIKAIGKGPELNAPRWRYKDMPKRCKYQRLFRRKTRHSSTG